MRLNSSDGASIELRPVRYQFGVRPGAPTGDWDANWLVVHGDVRTAEGRTWSFDDPCLTTWDARELGSWLVDAAEGRVEPTSGEPTLTFTEPNLALSVASAGGDGLVLRIHLSVESVMVPEDVASPPDLYEFSIPLSLSRADLLRASEEWRAETRPYPER